MTLEYKELSKRIKAAKTLQTLRRLEISCHRIYSAGFMTENEFQQLDVMIVNRLVKL